MQFFRHKIDKVYRILKYIPKAHPQRTYLNNPVDSVNLVSKIKLLTARGGARMVMGAGYSGAAKGDLAAMAFSFGGAFHPLTGKRNPLSP